jgi:predicted acylesterase/phospholipase RssA
MKGGITSGVIYPLVVCELADRYRFKSIGGTSAGAIAATATAAAEYGRRSGRANAYDGLRALPGWLGSDGRLLAMFRPDETTRPLFQAVLAALDTPGGGWTKLAAAVLSAWRSFPLTAVLGALPGLLILLFVASEAGSWPLRVVAGLGAVALMVAGAVIAPSVRMVRRFGWAVPANFYGLTTGCEPAGGDDYPLTNWLDRLLNELAGKPRTVPLTFGDLWTAAQQGADIAALRDDPSLRSIDLQVVTSCLTHGRPYRFPFETKIFYFDPAAWRKLFPAHVVDWMVAHERPFDPASDPPEGATAEGVADLRRLPLPEDMPVVVAARMSLSFPVLISAVPLYAVDYTREYNRRNSKTRPKGDPRQAEVCWFSDGGISSNFPIHFFDAPFPRWPTFGVDLGEFPYDHTPGAPEEIDQVEPFAVDLPEKNNEGWEESWTRFDKGDGVSRLSGFADAIRNTMQNWRDTTQSKLPGYRRRIVHIYAAPWEGGYNLNMSGPVITRLGDRGKRAGAELAALDDAWWEEHRWTRFRSAMAVLETFLGQMPKGYHDGVSPRPLRALIARTQGTPPRAYPWHDPAQADFGAKATSDLIALRESWSAQNQHFNDGAPRPLPELRIGPRI